MRSQFLVGLAQNYRRRTRTKGERKDDIKGTLREDFDGLLSDRSCLHLGGGRNHFSKAGCIISVGKSLPVCELDSVADRVSMCVSTLMDPARSRKHDRYSLVQSARLAREARTDSYICVYCKRDTVYVLSSRDATSQPVCICIALEGM